MLWRHITFVVDSILFPLLRGPWTEVICLCEDLWSSRVNPVFHVKEGGIGVPFHTCFIGAKFGKVVEL